MRVIGVGNGVGVGSQPLIVDVLGHVLKLLIVILQYALAGLGLNLGRSTDGLGFGRRGAVGGRGRWFDGAGLGRRSFDGLPGLRLGHFGHAHQGFVLEQLAPLFALVSFVGREGSFFKVSFKAFLHGEVEGLRQQIPVQGLSILGALQNEVARKFGELQAAALHLIINLGLKAAQVFDVRLQQKLAPVVQALDAEVEDALGEGIIDALRLIVGRAQALYHGGDKNLFFSGLGRIAAPVEPVGSQTENSHHQKGVQAQL